VWLTVTNAGDNAANGLAPSLAFGDPVSAEVVGGPDPAGGITLVPGGSQTWTWTIRPKKAGSVQVTAGAAGTDDGDASAVSTQATAAVGSTGRFEEELVVFPVPVSGDRMTVALRLGGDAREVEIRVYNAAFREVFGGAWRDVAAWDDRFTIGGTGDWAPGPYLVRARAVLADGTTHRFPTVKFLVKR
jgi:hypothetical protein